MARSWILWHLLKTRILIPRVTYPPRWHQSRSINRKCMRFIFTARISRRQQFINFTLALRSVAHSLWKIVSFYDNNYISFVEIYAYYYYYYYYYSLYKTIQLISCSYWEFTQFPFTIYSILFLYIKKLLVWKWCAIEVWLTPVFTLCYREHIHDLKSKNGWLSAIFCLWNFSPKCRAIIRQLTATPFISVPSFLVGNYLVRSTCVLIAPLPKIFCEEVWVRI
jgi:hypothetical protein